nr:MAG TPA: hypothetical protein [Caudoviricetes sp.]
MTLEELMTGHTLETNFTGFVTNDDFVLAIDCGATAATDYTGADDFAVVQMGVAGLDSNLNPITQDKTYIRAGQSTAKTGNQRSFSVTGDRYVGDEFQDFVLSHAIKYGTGQAVVRKYVYFNIITGKGEKGEVVIIVNSDGSGEAGNSAELDIELRKSGSAPTEYTYTVSA